MSDIIRDSKVVIEVLVIAMLVAFIVIIPINVIEKVSCHKKYEEYQPSYSFLTGCRILVDGKPTPVEIVREIK